MEGILKELQENSKENKKHLYIQKSKITKSDRNKGD